ncbi:ATP-binding protein [Halogeometricum borinquense]|uniref:ATP-binding protein n=1 Tax=Halogeometricum borinquense TaxID=60847 RepID=A0A6C0UJC8_9EURY|nr:helicase HerA-like domain-containing protein [Halogeometricum borinquense]QIB73058.1 ATP-binding protein [Halogeometricum borinquense]QIQ77542.1 ATP-binding protein [Halogeometricum borinquense]
MKTDVLGRRADLTESVDASTAEHTGLAARFDGPVARFGHHRARDGSDGAPVAVDLDGPHAALVVGKRGYGKSYTLGVLAEEVSRASGVAPVVLDPMGVFAGLTESDAIPGHFVRTPTVRADAIPPSAWPELVGCDPDSPVGSMVWRAASESETLAEMRAFAEVPADSANVSPDTVRAVQNRLRRAASWGVFDPDGLDAAALCGSEATVLDCAGLDPAPMNAVAYAVARTLYDARVTGTVARLPWLFLDEAHVFFDGLAAPALRTILTRGRAPGVSLVAATQRPSALPEVALSQSDLRIVHRLTAGADVRALTAAEPTYLSAGVAERIPTQPGDVLVVDDTAEAAYDVRVRKRDTPHGGDSPRASQFDPSSADSVGTETTE